MMEFMPEYEVSGYFPGLVEICKAEEDKLLFLIQKDGNVSLEKEAIVEGGTVVPPEITQLPRPIGLSLPDASLVMEWIAKEDHSLYHDVLTYLRRFAYLDELQLNLVAHFVFLTYLHDHPAINYCPYLLFYAVPERGKSRVGKSLTYISFRGFHSIDLNAPFLFRFAENIHGTLFLDQMDLWKKAEKHNCEDLLLLRAEKGAQCSRVMYPDRGRFRDTVYYDIYGPTIIATNEPPHKILETRCLQIVMPNHPGDYENPEPEYAKELRARLTALRAKGLLARLPEIIPISGISGRLWDITKPLLQIARLINPENEIILEEAILAIAGERSAEKRNTTEGRLVEIIYDFHQENGLSDLPEWSIPTSYITDRFNEGRPSDRKVAASWIGRKLKSLSLKRKRVNGCSKYLITQSEFKTLLSQYGLSEKQKPVSIRVNDSATSLPPEKFQPFQGDEQVVARSSRLHEGGSIQKEMFEERAAIMEYEGGLNREEAESKAALGPEIPF